MDKKRLKESKLLTWFSSKFSRKNLHKSQDFRKEKKEL